MKIVQVSFDMPYHPYNEPESPAKRQADLDSLHERLRDKGIKIDPVASTQVFVTSDHAIELLLEFPMNVHQNIRVSNIVEVFDGTTKTIDDLHGILSRLQIASTRMEAQIAAMLPDEAHLPGYGLGIPGWNGHTASPIPGPALASFNDLSLCEDACTDAIQEMLNEGWRIVAVCPQESRRPDYVLGRCVAERIFRHGGARRGNE